MSENEPKGPAAQLRILVAEDDAAERDAALSLLGLLGHSADVAVDGRQAADAAETGSYDLVLMDVLMPGMDGVAAAGEIRRLRPAPPPRIVAMSAYATNEERLRCFDAGMQGFIPKPLTAEVLLDELNAAAFTVLDVDVLRRMAEGIGMESAAEVVSIYLRETPVRLAAFSHGLGEGDAGAVRRAAHSLRSTSHMVGAVALAVAAETAEDLAADGGIERVDGMGLHQEFDRIRGWLTARLQELEEGTYGRASNSDL